VVKKNKKASANDTNRHTLDEKVAYGLGEVPWYLEENKVCELIVGAPAEKWGARISNLKRWHVKRVSKRSKVDKKLYSGYRIFQQKDGFTRNLTVKKDGKVGVNVIEETQDSYQPEWADLWTFEHAQGSGYNISSLKQHLVSKKYLVSSKSGPAPVLVSENFPTLTEWQVNPVISILVMSLRLAMLSIDTNRWALLII